MWILDVVFIEILQYRDIGAYEKRHAGKDSTLVSDLTPEIWRKKSPWDQGRGVA
jgi:hypothetical protein